MEQAIIRVGFSEGAMGVERVPCHDSTTWVFLGTLGSPKYENQMPPEKNWDALAVLAPCL